MTSHASTVFRLILLITVLSYAIHTPASPSNRFLEGTGTTSANPLLSDHISSLAMNVMCGLARAEVLAAMTKSNGNGKTSQLWMDFSTMMC